MSIKEHYDKLNPSRKRIVIMAFAGSLFLFAIVLVTTLLDRTPTQIINNNNEDLKLPRDFLTGQNTRKLGIEGMESQIQTTKQDVKQMKDDIKQIMTSSENSNQQLLSHISQLNNENRELLKKLTNLEQVKVMPMPSNIFDQSTGKAKLTEVRNTNVRTKEKKLFEIDDDEDEEVSVSPKSVFRTTPENQKEKTQNIVNSSSIRIIEEIIDNDEKEDGKDLEKTTPGLMLSAGSIIKGTMITGMDAPTSLVTKSDPMPTLLRIKHEAILPNRFRVDIRECFLIAAGYGELSSERAHLRSETISCVRKDGKAIEVGLDAYAVGEDGKSGIRGRLVSKEGTLVARTLMAGFMSGISDAFKPNPVQGILTNPDGNVSYQVPRAGDVAKIGTLSGVSNSMDRLADFYMDMAKDIFPIIEIDAGRSIEFVVKRGVELALN